MEGGGTHGADGLHARKALGRGTEGAAVVEVGLNVHAVGALGGELGEGRGWRQRLRRRKASGRREGEERWMWEMTRLTEKAEDEGKSGEEHFVLCTRGSCGRGERCGGGLGEADVPAYVSRAPSSQRTR
jgi:hypothetical protein